MRTVISARDIEQLLASGGDIKSLPDDAIITPSAQDLLRDLENRRVMKTNGEAAASSSFAVAPASNGAVQAPTKALTSKSSKSELEAFFNSPYCQSLKEQLCD